MSVAVMCQKYGLFYRLQLFYGINKFKVNLKKMK